MKKDRRNFIKNSFLLGSSAFFLSFSEKKQIPTITHASSWDEIRKNFTLAEDYSYMNNGTMGVSPQTVIEETIAKIKIADSTGHYGGGEKELLEKLGNFLDVKSTQLAITKNVTEGTNMILMSIPLRKKNEVICTSHEHAGTAIPLIYRSQRDGFKLKVVAIDQNPYKTTENILNAITKKTKLICIPHMPCTIGQVLEVKKICQEAKKRGIYTFIDGAHPPGMLHFSISDLGCDFYSGCGHKWMLGPKGTGFLYIREGLEKLTPPLFVGAGSYGHYELSTQKQEISNITQGANGYHFGSHNAALFYGWVAAIDFLNQITMPRVEKRVKELSLKLRNELAHYFPQVQFLCPDEDVFRSGICCFKMSGKNSKDIFSELMNAKVRVRHIHEAQLDAVRVSCHIYNNESDIDRLISELKKII